MLIDRLAAADGNLVLIEGSPHRDLDSDATRRTERTPFDGDFVVELVYPARRWLLACAVLAWLAGAALLSRRTSAAPGSADVRRAARGVSRR